MATPGTPAEHRPVSPADVREFTSLLWFFGYTEDSVGRMHNKAQNELSQRTEPVLSRQNYALYQQAGGNP